MFPHFSQSRGGERAKVLQNIATFKKTFSKKSYKKSQITCKNQPITSIWLFGSRKAPRIEPKSSFRGRLHVHEQNTLQGHFARTLCKDTLQGKHFADCMCKNGLLGVRSHFRSKNKTKQRARRNDGKQGQTVNASEFA